MGERIFMGLSPTDRRNPSTPFEIHHTLSKIDFKISHRSHFDFQNITLTSGVLVLTLVVIYLAKHSYSKSKHHTIVSIMKNHT